MPRIQAKETSALISDFSLRKLCQVEFFGGFFFEKVVLDYFLLLTDRFLRRFCQFVLSVPPAFALRLTERRKTLVTGRCGPFLFKMAKKFGCLALNFETLFVAIFLVHMEVQWR